MHNIELSSSQQKRERFETLLPQIKSLVAGEPDIVANLSNISAALKQGCGYFWVGFYLVKGDELVLGPFQGPVACTRIPMGKGVCGISWQRKEVVSVPDVENFPGHIACNSASKSEIVLPVMKQEKVVMVLDADSDKLNDFDEHDRWLLTRVVKIIERILI